jgi:hypothetical protein
MISKIDGLIIKQIAKEHSIGATHLKMNWST